MAQLSRNNESRYFVLNIVFMDLGEFRRFQLALFGSPPVGFQTNQFQIPMCLFSVALAPSDPCPGVQGSVRDGLQLQAVRCGGVEAP